VLEGVELAGDGRRVADDCGGELRMVDDCSDELRIVDDRGDELSDPDSCGDELGIVDVVNMLKGSDRVSLSRLSLLEDTDLLVFVKLVRLNAVGEEL